LTDIYEEIYKTARNNEFEKSSPFVFDNIRPRLSWHEGRNASILFRFRKI